MCFSSLRWATDTHSGATDTWVAMNTLGGLLNTWGGYEHLRGATEHLGGNMYCSSLRWATKTPGRGF